MQDSSSICYGLCIQATALRAEIVLLHNTDNREEDRDLTLHVVQRVQ